MRSNDGENGFGKKRGFTGTYAASAIDAELTSSSSSFTQKESSRKRQQKERLKEQKESGHRRMCLQSQVLSAWWLRLHITSCLSTKTAGMRALPLRYPGAISLSYKYLAGKNIHYAAAERKKGLVGSIPPKAKSLYSPQKYKIAPPPPQR